jgi:hypothetical protein
MVRVNTKLQRLLLDISEPATSEDTAPSQVAHALAEALKTNTSLTIIEIGGFVPQHFAASIARCAPPECSLNVP